MVNNQSYRLLLPPKCKIKKTARGGQRIVNGPVYDLALAQSLLYEYGFLVVNEDAKDDKKSQFNPEMDDDELADFVTALTDDDFDGAERCKTSTGMTVDCDGYAMKWNRNRRCRWEYGAKIYVKFGFATEDDLTMLVLCIHPSKW